MGTVVALGVGAAGFTTGDAVGGGGVTGGVGGVAGVGTGVVGVVGVVTGGRLGLGDGRLGPGRVPGCGLACLGPTGGVCTVLARDAASGWTGAVTRTASFFAATL